VGDVENQQQHYPERTGFPLRKERADLQKPPRCATAGGFVTNQRSLQSLFDFAIPDSIGRLARKASENSIIASDHHRNGPARAQGNVRFQSKSGRAGREGRRLILTDAVEKRLGATAQL
jgi:hypothetical protein